MTAFAEMGETPAISTQTTYALAFNRNPKPILRIHVQGLDNITWQGIFVSRLVAINLVTHTIVTGQAILAGYP